MYLIFPTFSKSAPRNIEVNTKKRKNKMCVISYEDARAIKQARQRCITIPSGRCD